MNHRYNFVDPDEKMDKAFGYFGIALFALFITVFVWLMLLSNKFVKAKIKNDASIAESTKIIADAAVAGACRETGYFFHEDRIYPCEHTPKMTLEEKTQQIKERYATPGPVGKIDVADTKGTFWSWY